MNTTNNTNKVTAKCDDETAIIAIYLSNASVTDNPIENGASVTWAVGDNTLTVVVAAEPGITTTYTVSVHKS